MDVRGTSVTTQQTWPANVTYILVSSRSTMWDKVSAENKDFTISFIQEGWQHADGGISKTDAWIYSD